MPFKKALHTVASLQVQGVEIDARNELKPSEITGTALRQIRKMLDDLNLRVVSINFRTRRGYDCIEDLDRRVDATKQAMRLAHDLGAGFVVNSVGQITKDIASTEPGEDREVEERRSLLRQVLSDLSRYGQHVGAMLACETGSEPISRLAALIDSMPLAALGITLNPGNLFVNGFDLRDLSQATSHIVLVHAKDGVRDVARGRGTEVPLGRGMADFPEIAAALEEHRYPGYFVIERDNTPNPLPEIALSVEYLRSL